MSLGNRAWVGGAGRRGMYFDSAPSAGSGQIFRRAWVLGLVVRNAPVRQAQGRLSDGLRGGSPRDGEE